ncbi:formin-like protein 1 [Tympanuchus pallidicinctus]|uniref:formin-like protein 1 n=1 Tax=Tympanuchus pallidicinctus TaxID=109042 RepID=UPI002286EC60|nr:formin-like protein 1 [Tympanuchus pallidicinctus]
MAAAGEPPSDEPPAWFLELQELQELLMAAEPLEPPAPGGAQQEEEPAPLWAAGDPARREPDETLSAELLQLLGADGAAPEPPQPHRNPPGEAEGRPVGRGAKRKRAGGEQQSEQRLRQLSAHNERLRAEVGRLSAEVQRMRAALIERVLSLRRA